MRKWSQRERGLGAALVLVALAAIAVPAWAVDAEDPAGAASELSLERAPVPAGGDGERVLPAPSGEELERFERFERCMRERGVTLPAPPPLEEEPSVAPLPAPGEEFERAAEACGMPGPDHAIAFAGPGEGAPDRVCPLPPPPPAPKG